MRWRLLEDVYLSMCRFNGYIAAYLSSRYRQRAWRECCAGCLYDRSQDPLY